MESAKSETGGATGTAGAPGRVLVAEDHPALAGTIRRWLERDGLVCDVAHSAADAMAAIRASSYDLLLTDIHMPDGSGIDLATRLKATDPAVQVVVITGSGSVESAVAALRIHADDYLAKPFESAALLRSVRRALEHRRLLLESRHHQRELEQRVAAQARRLEGLYLSSIKALVSALEAKDPYTRGHSDRVTAYAVSIAAAMGGFDLDTVHMGGQLHDIGKIGVRSAVLVKDGPLAPAEWEQIRRHPEVGVQILDPLLEDRVILDIVRHHHERWDGAGYPDGLAGDAIPAAARIVAVADAFDAMTTIRPYRGARSAEAAIAEIEEGAGRQFCPEVARHAAAALLGASAMAS